MINYEKNLRASELFVYGPRRGDDRASREIRNSAPVAEKGMRSMVRSTRAVLLLVWLTGPRSATKRSHTVIFHLSRINGEPVRRNQGAAGGEDAFMSVI